MSTMENSNPGEEVVAQPVSQPGKHHEPPTIQQVQTALTTGDAQKNAQLTAPTATVLSADYKQDVTGSASKVCTDRLDIKRDGPIVSPTVHAEHPTDTVQIRASPMREYYADAGFGQIATITKTGGGTTYNVNMHPLPYDVSPFKEEPPTVEDCQPITSYRQAMGYENSFVYTLPVVGNQGSAEDDDVKDWVTDGASIHTIPALTILKNNLRGNPNQGMEWPLYASQNPRHTASYLHTVQHRFSKHVGLDLRFGIQASLEGDVKETYTLGRAWTPLTDFTLAWVDDASNYDAAAPDLAPAFASLETINLDDKKEITSIVSTFRFVDVTPVDASSSMLRCMREVSRTKASMSRLYWRTWCAILEATAAEHCNTVWNVKGIRNTMIPQTLNNHKVMIQALQEAQGDVQPFFVSHQMIADCQGLPVIDLMYFLTCEQYDSETTFGLSHNWPSLGKVRLYAPEENTTFRTTRAEMTVRSTDLYDLLEYFARVFGQQQLIEEIGRTVAAFALRPEGDRAWLGHQYFKMALPPFRCARTIHLAWPVIQKMEPYRMKRMALYKICWVGAIRYLMISLCANVVLNERGIFSALQLHANGVVMPPDWDARIAQLFRENHGSCDFNRKMQEVGLRLDWGQVLNRTLGSISFIKPRMPNFLRLAQWSDWLLFQRIQPEGAWMGAQISHVKPIKVLRPGISYTPAICNMEWGENDIFYRMLVRDLADIRLHVYSRAGNVRESRLAKALCGPTGLPLDGQFKHTRAGDDLITSYEFVLRHPVDCTQLMFDWTRRTRYSWDLVAPTRFMPKARLIDGEEEYNICNFEGPNQHELAALRASGFSVGEPVYLPPSREWGTEQVLVFGNPTSPPNEDAASVASSRKSNSTLSAVLRQRLKLHKRTAGVWGGLDDPGTQSSDSEDSNAVDPKAMRYQKFPIHYCERDTAPSVGERVLLYGYKKVKRTCGVSELSIYDIFKIARRHEANTPLGFYVVPAQHLAPHRGSGSPHDKYNRQVRSVSQPNAQAVPENTAAAEEAALAIEMERLIREQEERKIKAEEKGRRQEEAIKKAKEAADAEERLVPGVAVRTIKASVYAWAAGQQVEVDTLRDDPLWKSLDAMQDVATTAAGGTITLRNRYNAILDCIDNTDLLTWLRGFPMMLRGELCRQMAALMNACAAYLPGGETKYGVHKKAHAFFYAAADNLANCAALTTEELQQVTGNPYAVNDDWEPVGQLNEMDFVNWITMFICAQPPEADAKPLGTDEATTPLNGQVIDSGNASPTVLIEQELKKDAEDRTQDFHSVGQLGSVPSLPISACTPEAQVTGPDVVQHTARGTSNRWADAISNPSDATPANPKRNKRTPRRRSKAVSAQSSSSGSEQQSAEDRRKVTGGVPPQTTPPASSSSQNMHASHVISADAAPSQAWFARPEPQL
ncbi:MAG: hypothetical protein SaTV3_gp1 [Sanya totivirus 3]|nr:MAG: hypothetical protein SaTV3_gp1 [Sanya totivirus 3]